MSPLLTPELKENINLSLKRQLTSFIPNTGQLSSPTKFFAKGPNSILYFTPAAVNIIFRNDLSRKNNLMYYHQRFNPVRKRQADEPEEISLALSFRFMNANPLVSIEGRKKKSGFIHFFNGSDPTKWQNNLHCYEEIVYHELWPYIDMTFQNANGILKYKYILRPGANLNDICLLYDGADDLSIDKEGNLLLHTPLGTLTDQRPISYQQNTEHQIPITTEFVLEHLPEGASCFGFTVSEDYDAHYPLVIDPGLIYSTFVSGGAV